MCQACVREGDISQWLYDLIEAFCVRYSEGGPYYGFGHIVLDDCNIDTSDIEWCLTKADRDGRSSDPAVESFLKWMLTIPEEERIGKRECWTCHSRGFDESILGPDRCSFCDGTEGGNEPR